MNREADTTTVVVDVEPRESRAVQPLEWSGVLAQQGYVFGVDISGDGERVVLADLRGNVLGRSAHSSSNSPSPLPAPPDEVMARVGAMMRELLKKKGVKGREVLRVGVGFGGPVDSRLGIVRTAHGAPGWDGFRVAAGIESLFDATTLLENDARLAALGEVWFGTGQGDTGIDLIYIHWSTGVGGGIVADGRLLRGATTIAGEIGHTVVRTGKDALACRCGGRGHLEAYVRAPALLQRAQSLLGDTPRTDYPPSDIASLFAQAEHDTILRHFVEEAVEMMAVTVANLITSMNPKVAVIGGRVAREGAHLIPRIGELARGYAMPVSAQDVTIAPAVLGEEATVMGAVALALDSLR
jgi:glucokinase